MNLLSGRFLNAPQDKWTVWLDRVGVKLLTADLHCTACWWDSADSGCECTVQHMQTGQTQREGISDQSLERSYQDLYYIHNTHTHTMSVWDLPLMGDLLNQPLKKNWELTLMDNQPVCIILAIRDICKLKYLPKTWMFQAADWTQRAFWGRHCCF